MFRSKPPTAHVIYFANISPVHLLHGIDEHGRYYLSVYDGSVNPTYIAVLKSRSSAIRSNNFNQEFVVIIIL